MEKNELLKYFQTKYSHKDILNDEELDWISEQLDVDWAIDSVLLARRNKNANELYKKNENYLHPIKGARERQKASHDNGTAPINGIINVGMPAAMMTGMVLNPFGTLGAVGLGGAAMVAGDAATNYLSGGQYSSLAGLMLDKLGMSRTEADMLNPLMLLGGKYGYKGGTAFGSKLFNGLHLPIGYDPVGGWYKRNPYSTTSLNLTTNLPAIPAAHPASAKELGFKPFPVIGPTATQAVEGSARRAAALATPTELASSGQTIITPPMDLSRGTWDFYRTAMLENPVLALPSVQAWLRQYGDVRTPQQWMLAGTRNLNLLSGINNPRSALFNAFGNVYLRDGVYTGSMPALGDGTIPMRYTFTPGQEDPMLGQMNISFTDGTWSDYTPFPYNLRHLPFRALFRPVMRTDRHGNNPTMRLAADRTNLTRGEGNHYLDIFGPHIARAQRRAEALDLFMRGLLPRRGTVEHIDGEDGALLTFGTNIFGLLIQPETRAHRLPWDPMFVRPWRLVPDANPDHPLIEEGALLETLPEIIQVSPDGTFNPVKLKLIDPFSGPTQNRGLALPGNMGHYQLKSLMVGSPLEKQLSKNGTININSLRVHLLKASDIDKYVIEKVLSEKFADQTTINYGLLKAEVLKELILSYRRVPQNRYADYGLDYIGYDIDKIPDGAGGILATTPAGRLNTFTLESDMIPFGSNRHYDSSTLGHIRTFTNNNEPNILYVLENQSDWGQRVDLLTGKLPENLPPSKYYDFDLMIEAYLNGENPYLLEIYETEEAINQHFNQLRLNAEKYNRRMHRYGATPLLKYLHDNYLYRLIHEALKFAAEQNQSVVRFPTMETAAQIEKYPLLSTTVKQLPDEYKHLQPLVDELMRVLQEYIAARESLGIYKSGTGRKQRATISQQINDLNTQYNSKIKQLVRNINNEFSKNRSSFRIELDLIEDLSGHAIEIYNLIDNGTRNYGYLSILRKYANFPKMFEKLFGKGTVRIVTDSKGNTWYEVDVPENYLDQEWQFKQGGKINYLNIF